jgi:hypothetical protein
MSAPRGNPVRHPFRDLRWVRCGLGLLTGLPRPSCRGTATCSSLTFQTRRRRFSGPPELDSVALRPPAGAARSGTRGFAHASTAADDITCGRAAGQREPKRNLAHRAQLLAARVLPRVQQCEGRETCSSWLLHNDAPGRLPDRLTALIAHLALDIAEYRFGEPQSA